MSRDITEDVKIDRYALEQESEEHSSIYYYWSEKFVEAKKDRDTLKSKFKETQAKISLDYRSDRLELDCKKTEASVEAAVEIHPDVVASKTAYLDAEYLVNKYGASEDALRQKKSMLDNLVNLYQMQYYSTPGTKRPEKNDVASDDLRKQINNKKRNKEN